MAHKRLRNAVFDRDGDRCVYCEETPHGPTFISKEVVRLTLDHIIPSSQSGRTELANLVACCNRCNRIKGDQDIVEWLASLKPKTSYHGERAVKMVVLAMSSGPRDPWEDDALSRIKERFSYIL